jgi:hypothetical protein
VFRSAAANLLFYCEFGLLLRFMRGNLLQLRLSTPSS